MKSRLTLTLLIASLFGTSAFAQNYTFRKPVQGLSASPTSTVSQLTVEPSPMYFLVGDLMPSRVSSSKLITNSGASSLLGLSIGVSGNFASNTTCGGSLAPAASCVVNVNYLPHQPGEAASGTLTITSSNAGTSTISLQGSCCNVPSNLAVMSVDTLPLSFPVTAVGSQSSSIIRTLTNTGNAVLPTLAITSSGEVEVSTTCGNSLAPGNSCSIYASWKPTSPIHPPVSNPQVGYVFITAGDMYGQISIPAFGQPNAITPGVLSVDTSTISFPDTPLYSVSSWYDPLSNWIDPATGIRTSTSIKRTLSNTGSIALANLGIVGLNPAYPVSTTCGASLVPGGSCEIAVGFQPTNQIGLETGTIVIGADSIAPVEIPLSSTVTCPIPWTHNPGDPQTFIPGCGYY